VTNRHGKTPYLRVNSFSISQTRSVTLTEMPDTVRPPSDISGDGASTRATARTVMRAGKEWNGFGHFRGGRRERTFLPALIAFRGSSSG
jgi:hypothetical protein